MTLFINLCDNALQYFPNFKLKYKNNSLLIKILSIFMFFNKDFLTNTATSIGNTTYFPNENWVKNKPVTASIIILHELTHMHDSKKYSKLLFAVSYLFPLILFPFLALLFLISWKVAIPALLVCALPIPAYFRMIFERRAYMASLYAMKLFNDKFHYNINLDEQKDFFIKQFTGPQYYFMWPFPSIHNIFDVAVADIKAGKKPYQDDVFNMIDDLIAKS